MAIQVNVHPKVERQLTALEKQAKSPSIPAARARRIIGALIRGMPLASAGLMKRKTDRRVKNCLKFDLGFGYRLVCIKEEKIIYVLFVGNHDNCDNWLDNRSKKNPHKTALEMHSYTFENIPVSENTMSMVPFDDPCFCHIGQKDLRRVFKGLTG